MHEIKVFKNNQVTNKAQFDDLDRLTNWLNERKIENAFGKNDRWIRETDGTHTAERDIVVDQIIGESGEPVPLLRKEYFFPADYNYMIKDITNMHEREVKIFSRINKGSEKKNKFDQLISILLGEFSISQTLLILDKIKNNIELNELDNETLILIKELIK